MPSFFPLWTPDGTAAGGRAVGSPVAAQAPGPLRRLRMRPSPRGASARQDGPARAATTGFALVAAAESLRPRVVRTGERNRSETGVLLPAPPPLRTARAVE